MIKYIQEKFRTRILEGDALTLKTRKNIFLSFLIKFGSVGIGLILVPMTISYVNPVQYGIWLTLSSVISWFYFFDIGLGNGLKNKLAESNALGQFDKSKIYVSTTYAIIIAVSVIIFVLFLIANLFINWNNVLNIPSDPKLNLPLIALIIVSIFCLQFVFQLINTVLTACHEPAKVSVLLLIGQVLCLISIFLISRYSHGSLLILVIVIGGIPLLVTMVSNFWYFFRQFGYLRPSIKDIDLSYARQLLVIGGAFFVIQIGQLVLYQTDNIIVTQLFGPKEVTVFNMAYKLFSIVITVFTIGITPYWSAFTEAYHKQDFDWIKATFGKLKKGWLLIIVLTIILTIISPFIFKLWLKDMVTIPMNLSISMAVYVMASSFHMLCCLFLNGIGKIRLQLYLYVICFFFNIPLSIYLGKHFGIQGITYANVIILLLMGVVLYVQCNKILNKKAIGIWDR